IIDYLQRMQAGGRVESRVQEVSQITRSLKLMAKDLEVPVIVLCQLSRNTECAGGKNHRPQLADLRESGSIEQDADIVLMLYRDDYYQQPGGEEENMDRNDINTVEIIVAKNRHGPVGSVDLAWNSEFTLFTSIEKRDDDIFA
ncbi:MAG: DnaB-like helicase C-terminal domain-containing protein, partial [Clostridia bacterium]|nr:DnaB-like helicase C-terminal domain-containing protein [Clostridia bacterium]